MTNTSPSSVQPTQHPYLIAVVVSLAAFMEVLDTTIVNVSLTHIAGNLAASQDESSWVLTSYLVANGIVLPLSGWLADVIGRKKFFMLCIAAFTAASFACGMATSLPMLIVFRLFQGLAGGGLQPMQQSIVMDAFPPDKRGVAFGITGMTMIIAPILGPTLGGLITDNASWRWIFFMNVPVGILAFFLVGRLVQDPTHAVARGAKKIDYIGLGLVALALGCMQVVLDKGQEEDWFASYFIIAFSLISVTAFIAGVIWLLRQKDPIIDLGLIKQRSFGLACLMVFAVGFALYGCSVLLPLLVQSEFGYDATLAGMVLSPGGFALIILMPAVGRLVAKIQSRYLIAFGMLTVSIAMWMTSHITPQMDYDHFVMLRILQVVGLPFLFIPSSTMAFSNIPPEKSSKASALYSLMRNLGGSFGISLLLNYVTRHEQEHQSFLAAHLTPSSPVYSAALVHTTQGIMDMGYTHAAASSMAMNHLYQTLLNQSTILAYNDTFRFIAAITFVLSLVALTMPRNKVGKKASEAAAGAH